MIHAQFDFLTDLGPLNFISILRTEVSLAAITTASYNNTKQAITR